ncbi:alpha/beta hydrolases superfamily protein [Tanacetum coccineum]|uniref:Alpha/beta hydrolases superfamily protein n=1 Tax=Tanacetum coccineum TaxID=301880 RepID=A0ABQ4WAQ6_9ASTR
MVFRPWNPPLGTLIMEYLVKISKKACILELKRRHLKITVLTSYMLLASAAICQKWRCYIPTPRNPKGEEEQKRSCNVINSIGNNLLIPSEEEVRHDSLTEEHAHWFKQPSEKRSEELPEQSLFNELVDADKEPEEHELQLGLIVMFSKCMKKFLNKDKITKADLEGPVFELLKNRFKNNIELEYNLKQCHLALTDKIDRTNPKGERYEQEGIEDLIPHLWSPSIYKYNINAELGIHHWKDYRQWFYKGSIRLKSPHDVYSKLKIISVLRIKIVKKYGYGQKLLMRADELHKFSNGTLNKVYNKLEVMLRDNRSRRRLRRDEGSEGLSALLEGEETRPTTDCKRVAFLVVENYVKNACSIYGFIRSMMTTNGMFFFKFGLNDEMNLMLENGSWSIRDVPLILKKWSSDANIIKEDMCSIRVWVKFHDISIIVFMKDGLSANIELKDTLVVNILKFEGEGYIKSTIRVEYEWKPPRCSNCKVYGYVLVKFPKKIISDVSKKLKMPRQVTCGPPVGLKPTSDFVYRPVQPTSKTSGKKNSASTSGNKKQVGLSRQELAEKGVDSGMVSSTHGSSLVPSSSLNSIPLTKMINKIERQMLDGNLMVVDDDEKPLNKVDSDLVNLDSESDAGSGLR